MKINKFYESFQIRDYMNNENMDNTISKDHLDCSLGTNPFIDETIIKKHIEISKLNVNQYPLDSYTKLKEALVYFWNNQFSSNLNREEIGLGSGTMGIIRNLCTFLIDKNDYVLGCAPQFPRFITEVELRKANYEYYALEPNHNYQFNVSHFINKINNKYTMIHLENPNNPTGQIINITDIEKIVMIAKEHNIVVLVDEAYGEYMDSENSSIPLIKKYNNLVVFRSASKFWGYPNHRIGYLFADKEIIKIYNKISLPFPFPDYSCEIFKETLKSYSDFKKSNDMVIDTKKKIIKQLAPQNYLYTSLETPIFTVRSEKHENLYKALLRSGIISEPGEIFMNLGKNFSRIRIVKDDKRMIKILEKTL